MKKRMTAVAVAVVIAISGGLLYTAKNISDQPKQQASSAQMPIPQVPVAEVITQELNPTAEYTGYLSAPQSVEIKSRVGGVINSVSVPEGSYVRKGQVLFKIDPAPFQVALKTAQARLKAAEVQYSQAVLDFNRANKLVESGAVSNKVYDDALATKNNRQAQVQEAQAAVSAAKLDLSYTNITAPISGRIDRVLVTSGNLIAGGNTGNATALASKEVQTASQLSLVSAVANAYLVYKADQETLGLTKATLATQQKSYDLTRKLVDVGNATRFDLRQAEIGLRTAQTNYAKFLRITAQDRNALVLLLGSPLTQELAAQLDQSPKIPDQVVMQDIPVGLPSDLLQRRPDIRAAEHKLQAANANIGAARAAFFPSITLTGSAGTASSSLDNLFNAGTGAWSFMPKINLPIFNAGLNQANLDRSHIMKQIEVINYDKSIQTAFREVADGLAGKSTLDEQIKSQQQMIAASQDAHKLATLRFDAGEDNYLAVLDSQRTLYASQQALIQTRLERLNNQVNLYKALGGGWNEHTVQIERKSLK